MLLEKKRLINSSQLLDHFKHQINLLLLIMIYTSLAQGPPLPFLHLLERPYFLKVRCASGPEKHSPPSWTPNARYPLRAAKRKQRMTASLLRRRLPRSLPMARREVSLQQPVRLNSLPVGRGGGRGLGSPDKVWLIDTRSGQVQRNGVEFISPSNTSPIIPFNTDLSWLSTFWQQRLMFSTRLRLHITIYAVSLYSISQTSKQDLIYRDIPKETFFELYFASISK